MERNCSYADDQSAQGGQSNVDTLYIRTKESSLVCECVMIKYIFVVVYVVF